MSVKVGVRVRPFNQRESDLNCRLCVEMVGNMTRLFDADDPEHGKHRDYTFDYSFWSHDQFEVDERGYFVATTDKYADQQLVFEKVGIEILDNAWQGYHCCLFAYGQTGAGKSYSMVGYGANKGIVPIACEQIFNRIAKNPDKANKEYEVNVSMMEIYNEKVQDLLIPINKRPPEGHKIRQHKTLGIYVEGMSKHFVDTYESIEKKMEEGGRNRSVASTAMNASSSRAHTIISIEFKQIVMDKGKKRQKLSVIHLVDLAGSQKVGKTGATGDRLKEAAGINKSLSVLGLVISALADKALGKGKQTIVPYRNSCLTRILQNALGGNSKTLMICAISPATDNYEQTLSTLRYADQAKKIQNKAVINESQTDKLIRNLTEEREELKNKVQKMEEMLSKFTMGSISPQMLQQLKEVKDQEKYLNQTLADRQTTKEAKKKHEEEQEQKYAAKVDLSQPHISNLNEDPQLSRKINYPFLEGVSTIGRRNMEPPNIIEIGGMGIRQLHASIQRKEEGEQEKQINFFIIPQEFGQESNCYLNGDQILKQQKLFHLDRLSFGTNNMFLVLLPGTPTRTETDEKKVDWDYAQTELYLKKNILEKQQMEEKEKKMREQAEAILLQKEKLLKQLENSLKDSEEQRKRTAQQMEIEKIQIERRLREERLQQAKKLKEEIQKKKERLRQADFSLKDRNKDKYHFQRKLLKTLPKCIELNLIAKQFKKSVMMSVKMLLSDGDDEEEEVELRKRSIMIKVVNKDTGYSYWWQPQTLSNRYYIIKDMSQQYFQTGVIPNTSQKQDPFWDPPIPSLIGRSFLTTKALTYMFDNPATLPIIGEDEQCGELVVNLVPTDETGSRNLCEEMDEEEIQFEPEELLGKPFHFWIMVEKGMIPPHYQNIHVEYLFKVNQFAKDSFKTKNIQDQTIMPLFDYKQLHSFNLITQPLLKYLSQTKLIFKIYGVQKVEIQSKKQIKTREEVSKEVNSTRSNTQSTVSTEVNAKPATAKPIKKEVLDIEGPAKAPTKIAKKPENKVDKKKEDLRHGGSKANNKINQRDLKNQKDKDCIIY